VSEKSEERKSKGLHLEEHEIAGVFCGTVHQGDASSDSALLGKASPTRKLRGIHKREEGERNEKCLVGGRELWMKYLSAIKP
jgi:hypothetical protein